MAEADQKQRCDEAEQHREQPEPGGALLDLAASHQLLQPWHCAWLTQGGTLGSLAGKAAFRERGEPAHTWPWRAWSEDNPREGCLQAHASPPVPLSLGLHGDTPGQWPPCGPGRGFASSVAHGVLCFHADSRPCGSLAGADRESWSVLEPCHKDHIILQRCR